MTDVLETFITASKRAAAVARSCITPNNTLLMTEKGAGEANTRFVKDYKTVADVLAQESAKSIIASRFPSLADHVRGEECAEINGVQITLQDSVEKTRQMLSVLVSPEQAQQMAEAAHSCDDDVLSDFELPKDLPSIDITDLGIWIDPIDATAEFIAGVKGETVGNESGLPCVTVLIGAYLRSTGVPVIGVINQPFYNNGEGRIVWGMCYNEFTEWGSNKTVKPLDAHVVLMSNAECAEMQQKFENCGWLIKTIPGAGHKLLKVSLGEASSYVVSTGSTYRWDTCAPHAILRARGGDVLCYRSRRPLTYNDPPRADSQQYANAGGIIAYRQRDVLAQITRILQ